MLTQVMRDIRSVSGLVCMISRVQIVIVIEVLPNMLVVAVGKSDWLVSPQLSLIEL